MGVSLVKVVNLLDGWSSDCGRDLRRVGVSRRAFFKQCVPWVEVFLYSASGPLIAEGTLFTALRAVHLFNSLLLDDEKTRRRAPAEKPTGCEKT